MATIKDKTGQITSITKDVWRALRLFTNRRELIGLFVSYLNDNPPQEKIIFFYGDGGNGKSLLLRYLREYYLKCFSPANWHYVKAIADNEEFITHVKDSVEGVQIVPCAALDFGDKVSSDHPQDVFSGLLILHRELYARGLRFPLFDFACVWHLKQTNQLSESRLKNLFPAEEMDLVVEIVNVASGTSIGAITKAVLNIFAKNVKESYTLYLHKRGLDEEQIESVKRLDAKSELLECLPDFFAHDLNMAMKQPGAPQRVVLMFDTHESFFEENQRDISADKYFRRDRWLRRLLCGLDYSLGIVAVVAGRENPNRADKENLRWEVAPDDFAISDEYVDVHMIGHLSPADAEEFLQKATIKDEILRQSLIKYAEVEPNEIHPLYLGLLVDIVLAAERRNETLTAADFRQQPQRESKEQNLINRLLSYVAPATKKAVIALAACRAFNRDIFIRLDEELKFHSTAAAFDILRSFSFVWQAERQGGNWYRIHDLLRRLFGEYEREKLQDAHRVMESYYREQTANDEIYLAEAIYHANRLDWERGANEWFDVFEKNLWMNRYQICRSLREVKHEMIINSDYVYGRLSQIDGDFYYFSTYYTEAQQKYIEAITAFENALNKGLKIVSIYIDKGFALERLGSVYKDLSNYQNALEKFQQAVEDYNKALNTGQK